MHYLTLTFCELYREKYKELQCSHTCFWMCLIWDISNSALDRKGTNIWNVKIVALCHCRTPSRVSWYQTCSCPHPAGKEKVRKELSRQRDPGQWRVSDRHKDHQVLCTPWGSIGVACDRGGLPRVEPVWSGQFQAGQDGDQSKPFPLPRVEQSHVHSDCTGGLLQRERQESGGDAPQPFGAGCVEKHCGVVHLRRGAERKDSGESHRAEWRASAVAAGQMWTKAPSVLHKYRRPDSSTAAAAHGGATRAMI